MQLIHRDPTQLKGLYAGPENSTLPLSVFYVNGLIEDAHYHLESTEVYLVAQGSARIRVEQETLDLAAGDVLICLPGEAHAFLSTSPDYFHFMILSPGQPGEAAQREKVRVSRQSLGLE